MSGADVKRALWLVVLAGACSRPPVHGTGSDALRVTPVSLDFGTVYLGSSGALRVNVVNPGLQGRTVPLSLAAPFFTEAQLVLQAGESTDLLVRFTPSGPGAASAMLVIDQTTVVLHAVALDDLSCAASTPCHTVSFDADAGVCLDVVRPDGDACTSNCVASGQCNGGVCRGAFKACDDGNGCSVDSCSETLGCMHSDIDCPAPLDPCQAAYCDPQAGCSFAPVQDGVSCGPDDCSIRSAQICLNGACVMRPIPTAELCFEVVAGVAGGPGYHDGRGDEARFESVRSFAVDRWDDVYLLDEKALRKVTPGGVVTTVAIAAQLADHQYTSIGSVDSYGNVYLGGANECGNYATGCVRKVSPLGQLSVLDCDCDDGGLTWSAAPFATRDGHLWAVDENAIKLRQADGGWQTMATGVDYSSQVNETAGGALVFIRMTSDNDAGVEKLQALALSADGGVSVLRDSPFYPFYGTTQAVWSLGPGGEMLVSRSSGDGGCDLIEDDPGVALQTRYVLPLDCFYVAPNVSTFTGSRYWNALRSFDGGSLVFEGTGVLDRVVDGGLAPIAGIRERPGTSDGLGVDAGLNLVAGYAAGIPRFDTLIAKADGGLLFTENYARSLRSYSESAGVVTLATFNSAEAYYSMRAEPSGDYWAWAQGGWLNLADDGDAGPLHPINDAGGLSNFLDYSQAAEDSDGGIWLFQPEYQGPIHVDASGNIDLQLEYLPTRHIVDGPVLDAGFYSAYGAVSRANGHVAFIDFNAVREIANGSVVTLAGAEASGYIDGPGAQARFAFPLGLAEAPNGELYVADSDNFSIRVIDAQNHVRTIGHLSDRPSAVAVTPDGTVYVLVRDALLRGR